MIQLTALLLAAATSQTSDTIFTDEFDTPYVCPESITTGSDTRTLRHTSDIIYLPVTTPRRNVVLTDWDNIWGHIDNLDGLMAWPGVAGASPTIQTLGKHEYIGAKFHVPEDASPLLWGGYVHPSYTGGPNIDFAISNRCGDFNPPQDACSVTNFTSDDGTIMYWRIAAGTPYKCHIDPGTDYYLNIRFTNPQTTGPNCSGSACQLTIQNWPSQ